MLGFPRGHQHCMCFFPLSFGNITRKKNTPHRKSTIQFTKMPVAKHEQSSKNWRSHCTTFSMEYTDSILLKLYRPDNNNEIIWTKIFGRNKNHYKLKRKWMSRTEKKKKKKKTTEKKLTKTITITNNKKIMFNVSYIMFSWNVHV